MLPANHFLAPKETQVGLFLKHYESLDSGFHERDQVGVQDFLLLENFESELAFIENLRKRFQKNLIYTYIGQVLISVNPYKKLSIYSKRHIKEYRNTHFYEIPPHIFALADNAFRSLIEEYKGQCVLISGESGSGKTEASKKVLQYITACSGHQSTVEHVKQKLLNSNPVLEAFGNAKTNRNDNSSRFGKYMEIQFDFTGTPIGGNILNYLLEKSRVISQNAGEQNFHIFYQLLAGGSEELLKELQLINSLDLYSYLSNSSWRSGSAFCADVRNFKIVKQALTVIGFSEKDEREIFCVIASVLHLGNVTFSKEEGAAQIVQGESIDAVANLLGVVGSELTAALTNRTIEAHDDVVTSPLNREGAVHARDAFAKTVYDRLFSWLVARLNSSLQAKSLVGANSNAMGILDIYGFEVFKENNFEQLCINYCNEKLQQLFIELTLKSEQLEYQREGVEWESIDYFDNKVICNLIEEKYKGIISILDEECMRPGDATDQTLLTKLTTNLSEHPHYISYHKAPAALRRTMGCDEFRLVHYAGDVTYNISGFLDKNKDLLFRDLKEIMGKSSNSIICTCFPADDYKNRQRPQTAITQFKSSLNNLMEILMNKEPSYIRCIKPNEQQAPDLFNVDLVLHQVKYLGLMENLRVRRAGFAYRRTYETFLNRYKCLSKDTWPNFHGTAREGVRILVEELKYSKDEYRFGTTKIFIRYPKPLFKTEDAYQAKRHEIASIMQACWRGRTQRKAFLKTRTQVIRMQSCCRRYLALRAAKKRRSAVSTICTFIKGYLTRNDLSANGYNERFIAQSKCLWLLRLANDLPNSLIAKQWPPAPPYCQEASTYLRRLFRLYLARLYRLNISPERKRHLELKVLAEQAFKDKKSNYAASIPDWFESDRIPVEHKAHIYSFVTSTFPTERLIYATSCTKYDRHGYKSRQRFVLLSSEALYVLDGKTYKQKHRLPLKKIGFVLSNHNEDLMVVRIPIESKRDKGDLILLIPHIIECCTFIIDTTGTFDVVDIVNRDCLEHKVNGKDGVIDLQTGS